MAFIPTTSTCDISCGGLVNSITDPLTNITLGATSNASRPEIKIDSDIVFYLDFSNHMLYKTGISVADVGGPNGNTTTFFVIMKTKAIKQPSSFNWVKEVSPGNYIHYVRLGVHIPWSDSNVYIDHASVSGGRLSTSSNCTLNTKEVWGYRRNVAWAELRLNNAYQHDVTILASSFTAGDIGRFMIGNGNQLAEPAAMDF